MKGWFSDLAHRDAAVREEAVVNLMGLRRTDLPLLERVIRKSMPLKPPQAIALRQIITQVYLSGDPYEPSPDAGFLGIELRTTVVTLGGENDPDSAQGGVVVVRRMPGFCGARMLRDGDVILGIVERPRVQFTTTDDFRAVVRDTGPGQTIHFQVLRLGRIIRVPITLDVRPADTGIMGLEELLQRRGEAADEYWQKNFAPVIKEGVS